MSNFLESLRAAFTAIFAHKLRSVLTTLGIIIGVMSVIAVVSLLQGFSLALSANFRGMGSNTIFVNAYVSRNDQLAGKTAKITTEDLLAIQHEVPGISRITPVLIIAFLNGQVQYQGQTTYSLIAGTTYTHAENTEFYPVRGRYLTPSDDFAHRRVAVVGASVVKDLQLGDNPEGRFIQMFGQWFKVIGVLKELGSFLGFDQDSRIYIPFGTAHSLLGGATNPSIQIDMDVNDVKQLDEIKGRITTVLRRQHGLKAGQDDDFKVQTAAQLADSINQIFNAASVILGGIVSIALLVGGIGIMNIMLVSVTERTREIGILKSLGARRSDILLQFLIEAVTLSLLGGLIGLALGYGIGLMVVKLVPAFEGAYVPLWTVALAMGFSMGVGIIFGIAPAAKAAALDPIDALRYE
ncbi:MAG TPA: ABC transporter permease [Gammaproteobacteria bacterium]|nr:ABC transporter permease [Gammaproteobacteria bacterium]